MSWCAEFELRVTHRLQLVVNMTDGTSLTMASAADGWKVRHGPITYDHLTLSLHLY